MKLHTITLHAPIPAGLAVINWEGAAGIGTMSGYIRKPDGTITVPMSHVGLEMAGFEVPRPGDNFTDGTTAATMFTAVASCARKFADALQQLHVLESSLKQPGWFNEANCHADDPRKPLLVAAIKLTMDKVPSEDQMTWFLEQLESGAASFDPEGWFICECRQLDSHNAGKRYMLPYGGRATHLAPPSVPFSVSGQSASDTAVVIATLTREQYGHYLEASR